MGDETEHTSEDATPKTPARKAKGRRGIPTGFTTLRDVISFTIGVAIVINEVFFSASVEAYSIGVGVALMGLPIVLGADERRQK